MALEIPRGLKTLGCARRNDSPKSQNWASRGAAAAARVSELSQRVTARSGNRRDRKLLQLLLDPGQGHACYDPHQPNRRCARPLAPAQPGLAPGLGQHAPVIVRGSSGTDAAETRALPPFCLPDPILLAGSKSLPNLPGREKGKGKGAQLCSRSACDPLPARDPRTHQHAPLPDSDFQTTPWQKLNFLCHPSYHNSLRPL